ncbi:TPA: hypothetical protein ACKPZT_000131 [Stenotrophomonas maltophilia]
MIGGVEGAGAPWWLAASAVALWLLRETWGAVLARRKERTETDANVDLLNGLVERVKSLETSQAEVVKQYNEEVRLRMKAQEDAHRLRLRVISLESALKQLGVVVPPRRGADGMNRVLLALLLGLSVLIIWQRGSVAQAHRAADIASAARDKARDERDAAAAALADANAVLALERASAQAANRLAATYEKEKDDAQKDSDRLVADLRAGNQRLHQRWQAVVATAELSAAAAAASQPDGRADDRIESAGRAIGAAAQCDAQVRALQAYALLCTGGSK